MMHGRKNIKFNLQITRNARCQGKYWIEWEHKAWKTGPGCLQQAQICW